MKSRRADNLSKNVFPPNNARNGVVDRRKEVDALKYHGTTTVALACSDGVVLCTDTRVTAGYLYIAHRQGKKVHRIDNHVGVTIAGTVAEAQSMIDTLRYYANLYRLENEKPIPIRSLGRISANIFFQNRYYPFIADFLIGGWDSIDGNVVYSVDFFGALTREDAVSTGSGSPVAYGIIEDQYRKGMRVDQVVPIAIQAVSAAIKRNAGTGDGFDVAVITKESGYRELSRQEKEEQLSAIPSSRN
ncbi:MAG TPA: proteasome subunit beta [Nitrososphaerales archaeon]|nr:proteasome subunit beta [Nitrososphaerales archaeon]